MDFTLYLRYKWKFPKDSQGFSVLGTFNPKEKKKWAEAEAEESKKRDAEYIRKQMQRQEIVLIAEENV